MGQYRIVGPQRDTLAEAIADCELYKARTRCRICRVQSQRRQADGTIVTAAKFQATAHGRKKTMHTSSGVCNSFGVRKPSDCQPLSRPGIYTQAESGDWQQIQ